MKKITVLYADDEVRYRNLVRMFLKDAGYEVILVENGDEAVEEVFSNKEIDIVLLDVMMPVLDGWQACKSIRAFSNIPILMLTALDDVSNEVKGIESGADDYVSKPFSHEILLARIKGLLRRVKNIDNDILEQEEFVFNENNYTITHEKHNIELRPKEFELLKTLVINKNIVLNREQLLDKVWGFDYEGDQRTVDTHIKSLRARLKNLGKHIVTLRGKGYSYRSEI